MWRLRPAFLVALLCLWCVEASELIVGPRIFIIGAQKASTTSLFELLKEHPQICGTKKEPHFFDSRPEFRKGPRFYELYFDCPSDTHALDGTPDYITSPVAALRMNSTFIPSAIREKKLILILREPVKREFSLYNHLKRLCLETMQKQLARYRSIHHLCGENGQPSRHCRALQCQKGLHAAKNGNLSLALSSFNEYIHSSSFHVNASRYITNIQRFLTVFERRQMFIVNFDRIVADTAFVMHKLCKFLEIDASFYDNDVTMPRENVNPSHLSEALDCKSRDELAALYRDSNAELYAFMKLKGGPKQQPKFQPFQDPASYPCVT